MRRFIAFVAAALAMVGATAQGQPHDDCQTVVAKAIKAMGLENKELPKGIRMKVKVKQQSDGGTMEILQQVTVGLPNQFKEVSDIYVEGKVISGTVVFDGKEGWFEMDGMLKTLDAAALDEMKNLSSLIEATHLITPLLEKKYQLTPIGEAKVDDRPVVGIRVAAKGVKHLDLYFDKQSNLLAKMERRSVDPGSGKQVVEGCIYKSYRDQDRRKAPKTILVLRNGVQDAELEILEYAFVNRIDPGEFARPKQ
jgi:hypothetical protein